MVCNFVVHDQLLQNQVTDHPQFLNPTMMSAFINNGGIVSIIFSRIPPVPGCLASEVHPPEHVDSHNTSPLQSNAPPINLSQGSARYAPLKKSNHANGITEHHRTSWVVKLEDDERRQVFSVCHANGCQTGLQSSGSADGMGIDVPGISNSPIQIRIQHFPS